MSNRAYRICARTRVNTRVGASDTDTRIAASRPSPNSHRRCNHATATRNGRTTAVSPRSEEHTSELQSLMRISYAVFCLKQKNHICNTYSNVTLYIETIL